MQVQHKSCDATQDVAHFDRSRFLRCVCFYELHFGGFVIRPVFILLSRISFEKQVFISEIGIYDKEKNLLGIAKLANPVTKKESQDYTFKLKLDM